MRSKKKDKVLGGEKMGFWDHPVVHVIGYGLVGAMALVAFALAIGLGSWIIKFLGEFFKAVINLLPSA